MARLLIILLVIALIFPIAESRIRYRPTINKRFYGKNACVNWQNAVRNNGFRDTYRLGLSTYRYVQPPKCPFPKRSY